MKSMTVAQATADVEAMLNAAQKERIVLIRDGKPSAVLLGVESYDAEDLQLATSAEFWEMIEARRKGRSISWDELKARLNGTRRASGKSAAKRPKQRKSD